MAEPVPLFAAIADAHLDHLGAWLRKGIVGDAEYSFTQAVDHAIATGMPWLFILGDTINRPDPRPAIVKFLFDQMDRCRAAGVKVGYILGQHEAGQDWLGIHPWPIFMDGRTVHLDEPAPPLHIHGISYKPRDAFQAALAALPGGIDILLTHQVWGDFMGEKANPQGWFADLPEDIDLITGDYHVHCIKTIKDNPSFCAYSCGSMTMQDIGEMPEKAFWTAWDRDGVEISSVALRTRPFRSFWCHDAVELDAVVRLGPARVLRDRDAADEAGMPVHLAAPVVEVIYWDDIPDATRRLTAAFSMIGHLFLRPKARRAADDVVDASTHEQRDIADRGLVAALESAVAADEPSYDPTYRLLTAIDPRAEMEALRNEFCGPTPAARAGEAAGDRGP